MQMMFLNPTWKLYENGVGRTLGPNVFALPDLWRRKP